MLQYQDTSTGAPFRVLPLFAIVLTAIYDSGEPIQGGDLVAIEYSSLSKQFPSSVNGLGIRSGGDSFSLTSIAIGWLQPDEIDPALSQFRDQPDASVSSP